MIDVIFLLLVFFMLASRFGAEAVLPLPVAGGGSAYDGPPRLIEIRPDGITLNGIAVAPEALAGAVAPLTTAPDDLVVLRGRGGADLQRIVDVAERLRAGGFTSIVLVE